MSIQSKNRTSAVFNLIDVDNSSINILGVAVTVNKDKVTSFLKNVYDINRVCIIDALEIKGVPSFRTADFIAVDTSNKSSVKSHTYIILKNGVLQFVRGFNLKGAFVNVGRVVSIIGEDDVAFNSNPHHLDVTNLRLPS